MKIIIVLLAMFSIFGCGGDDSAKNDPDAVKSTLYIASSNCPFPLSGSYTAYVSGTSLTIETGGENGDISCDIDTETLVCPFDYNYGGTAYRCYAEYARLVIRGDIFFNNILRCFYGDQSTTVCTIQTTH